MIFVTSRLLTDTYEKAVISFPVMFTPGGLQQMSSIPSRLPHSLATTLPKKEADFEKKEMFSFLQNVHKGDKQLHVEKR